VRPAEPELLVRPARHVYQVGAIELFLRMVLSAATSIRGAAAVFEMVMRHLPFAKLAPQPNSGRMWMLRVGLFQLTCEKERADDWVWMMDHTLQLGPYKCLIILGIRLSQWDRSRPLCHEDMTLLNLTPMESSSGEAVHEQLQATADVTGLPRAVVSDQGSDLMRSMQLFQRDQPSVRHQLDMKHKNARLLKAELDADPRWSEFVTQANRTKLATTQTSLAFLNPPGLKTKARYMNLDTLVDWATRTLAWLDSPARSDLPAADRRKVQKKLGWLGSFRPAVKRWSELLHVARTAESMVHAGIHTTIGDDVRTALEPVITNPSARRMAENVVAFLRAQSLDLPVGDRLIGSTEVLESVIGRYKRLQSTHSKGGMTAMLLSIGAIVGQRTHSVLQRALEKTRTSDVTTWCHKHLGLTIQAQKRTALSATKTE
jgi:hypothetical protein